MPCTLFGPTRCFDELYRDIPELVVAVAASKKAAVAVQCEADAVPADSAELGLEDLGSVASVSRLRVLCLF